MTHEANLMPIASSMDRIMLVVILSTMSLPFLILCEIHVKTKTHENAMFWVGRFRANLTKTKKLHSESNKSSCHSFNKLWHTESHVLRWRSYALPSICLDARSKRYVMRKRILCPSLRHGGRESDAVQYRFLCPSIRKLWRTRRILCPAVANFMPFSQ